MPELLGIKIGVRVAPRKQKTIYLAGKMTGDPEFISKFNQTAFLIELAGAGIVCNPASLPPEGFTYDQYLRMSMAMLVECDAIMLLPDWHESNGARLEYVRAVNDGKEVYFYEEWEKNGKVPL